MSSVTLASLERITAETLSQKLLAEQEDSSNPAIAVVDVRDSDYIGGHIKSSLHFPSAQIETLLPTLCRKVKDTPIVVFHCMLSQQRGPWVALKYLRERKKVLTDLEVEALADDQQKVYLLERGFQGWQERYGEDERLTEGYVKHLHD